MAYSKFDLTGKVALVTGGASGIGLGYAEALAQAGADLAIWARNDARNRQAAELLQRHGRRVLPLRVDVSDERQVEDAFTRTVSELGRVDSCFANSGIGSRGTPFADMSIAEWRDIFAVNMEGVFLTFRAAVRHMKERGGPGSLVVTSSSASIFGAPRSEHYAATKAGVNALIRGLAVEHARDGIRANAVLPGWIDTPMTERLFNNETFVDRVLKRVPLRRWGVGDDFGGIAVYLASDASAYHTGDCMVIDGGYRCF
jgi:hypothetical protein